MTEWFREFFGADYLRAYGPRNRREAPAEVRYIERALGMEQGSDYLDLCCGEGRHAVPLAGRGYLLVGLDLSPVLLEAARRATEAAGAPVDLVRGDSRSIPFGERFDGVYCWFTTFGYFAEPAEDARVLSEVGRVLRPGGTFLLEVLNLDWHLENRYEVKRVEGDGCRMHSRMEFSPEDSTAVTWKEIRYPDRPARRYRITTRIYRRGELQEMFRAAGFTSVEFLPEGDPAAGNGGPPSRLLHIRGLRRG